MTSLMKYINAGFNISFKIIQIYKNKCKYMGWIQIRMPPRVSDPLGPCSYISVHLSLSLSLSVSLSVSVSVSVSVSFSFSISISPSICLTLSLTLSICLSIYFRSIFLYFYLSLSLFLYISSSLSIVRVVDRQKSPETRSPLLHMMMFWKCV